MSNTEGSAERSARRHQPAIWGIAIAILAAIVALLVFGPWRGPETPPAGEIVPPATVAPATPSTGTAPAAPATTAPAPGG